MNKEEKKQFKSFLFGVIYDYHNNNMSDSEISPKVIEYMLDKIGGDNKFFENYCEQLEENYISKEEVRKKIDIIIKGYDELIKKYNDDQEAIIELERIKNILNNLLKQLGL